MLPSYFVLIKLSVIKCLFNYNNVIIIIYKMQVKFINQSRIFSLLGLACFIICIIDLLTNLTNIVIFELFVLKIDIFRRDLLLLVHQPNYIFVQGRRQDLSSG